MAKPGTPLQSNFAAVATASGSFNSSGGLVSPVPLLVAAARTTDVEVPVSNWSPDYRGILLYLVGTTISGSGITLKLVAPSPLQNAAIGGGPTGVVIATAGAAVTTATTTSLAVYPAAITGYTTNIVSVMPPKLSVFVDHSDSAELTYKIYGYGLI